MSSFLLNAFNIFENMYCNHLLWTLIQCMWSSWINLHFFIYGAGTVFLRPLLNLMHYSDASETYKLNFLKILPILYLCIMKNLIWWNVNETLNNLHSTHFLKTILNENHLQKLKHSYENCMEKCCIPQHESKYSVKLLFTPMNIVYFCM